MNPCYKATPELEAWIINKARAHVVSQDGLPSFEALTKWCALEGQYEDVPMPVYPYFPDSPFTERADHAFQAWHDQVHCDLHAPFDLLGEYECAKEQVRQVREAGFGLEECQFIWFFVYGRNLYVYRNDGAECYHRAEFVENCFRLGMARAAKGERFCPGQYEYPHP